MHVRWGVVTRGACWRPPSNCRRSPPNRRRFAIDFRRLRTNRRRLRTNRRRLPVGYLNPTTDDLRPSFTGEEHKEKRNIASPKDRPRPSALPAAAPGVRAGVSEHPPS